MHDKQPSMFKVLQSSTSRSLLCTALYMRKRSTVLLYGHILRAATLRIAFNLYMSPLSKVEVLLQGSSRRRCPAKVLLSWKPLVRVNCLECSIWHADSRLGTASGTSVIMPLRPMAVRTRSLFAKKQCARWLTYDKT